MPGGGALLVTMRANDWEGTEEDFQGAKIFWIHYDAERNREIVERTGFTIVYKEIATTGGERHAVILAILDRK